MTQPTPVEERDAAPLAPLERKLASSQGPLDSNRLLELFLAYVEERGIEMYPAQEEAVLELLSGHNVVLNTPTGSGKSLVALAACFKAFAEGGTAFYTAPIKALVTEKFFELCAVLGRRNVGMMTGDASVNRDAPVVCCTAEILANLALREGENAGVDWVVMDEFHYYADRDRGVAWQIPLLSLPRTRFLLMSATLGNPEFFLGELERRTAAPATLVQSTVRPVPLDFHYSEKPLQDAIVELVAGGKAPIYIVHFAQRAASEQAQALMSLNFTTREDKQKIKTELAGFRFDSPFGRELSRFIPHGIGVHHAGMLPKYRRLVERLAQTGLLRVICGTDTLGVGVNVPIRTVLFTQLCKFDGRSVTILSSRDFHQIAGRAGRKGFDTQGSVIVQAPEHEIENKMLKQRAVDNPKKLKKLRLRKAPERGYKPWSEATLQSLRDAAPEPLQSSVSINHGLVLSVLSRDNGCRVGRSLLRECHESDASKRMLMRQALELFGSLISTQVVSLEGGQAFVNADLQQDFSLNQAVSLYAVEAFAALDPDAEGHALSVLSIVEATMENPSAILQRQVATLKTRLMNELKAQRVEYEERIEALEQVEYPKPEAEMIYETFNLFAKHHPWVAGHTISPKSVAREMHEQVLSFNDYVKEYGLARSEGVLLRYLTDVYRALCRTVPDKHKTDAVLDLEEWLGAELRQVDASLIREWETLDTGEVPSGDEASASDEPEDITRNQRAFAVLIRNASFRVLQAMSRRDEARLLSVLGDLEAPSAEVGGPVSQWSLPQVQELVAPYFEMHESIALDADARSPARVVVDSSDADTWEVRQIIGDPEEHHDWALVFSVDVVGSREQGRLVMNLKQLAFD